MTIVLVVTIGALVGGLARFVLPGRRELSASGTVVAGMLGSGTAGVVAAKVTGIGVAEGSLSIPGGVLGAMAIVLLAERVNERRRARTRRIPTAELIRLGEHQRLEFKSTARYNLRTASKDKAIELSIARNVAGFANSSGGSLIIGVDDEARPLGIDHDLQLVQGNDHDGFELWLYDLLAGCLDQAVVRHVAVQFDPVYVDGNEYVVCRVDVGAANRPVYLRPHTGDRSPRFPVRAGNSTRLLDVDNAVEYIGTRWPSRRLPRLGVRSESRPRALASATAVLLATGLVAGACSQATTQGPQSTSGPDPMAPEQWGHHAVGIPEAWDTARGQGIVIAVLDTGVSLDHPDLAENLVDGWDFIDDDEYPDDPNGHGTHVAGIAAAVGDNGIGISGAAPDARIMPVRVLDADGAGSDEVIADGIDWAVERGAHVVNLSLGESGFVSRLTKGGAINAAIRRATDAGVVVVAAAGNDHDVKRNYRVGVEVIVVNATNELGRLTNFSNTGDTRAVSAPGARITSTAPLSETTIWPDGTTGWAELDGTSMAAPLVAGAAAVLLSAGASPTDVADLLAAAGRNPAERDDLGAGVIDVEAAVAAVAAEA